ncbi:MAG: DUF6088 family protein [Gammaproteobacteria bacterium]|nr:DUF6088 family protein [Gammaproteobacteria bacterium]
MQSIEDKVISRIYGRGKGWAFTSADFSAEFNRNSVDVALSHLVKANKIRRVCRGVYDYPKYSELLKQILSPDIDQVAQALARKFNWRIQASGNAALNLLGLSTQIPGKFVYLSDGPDRAYQIGSSELFFKKEALKNIGFKLRESGLIVHALKTLGQKHVNDEVIEKIRTQIDENKYKPIMKDTQTVTGWVYEVIRKICLDSN